MQPYTATWQSFCPQPSTASADIHLPFIKRVEDIIYKMPRHIGETSLTKVRNLPFIDLGCGKIVSANTRFARLLNCSEYIGVDLLPKHLSNTQFSRYVQADMLAYAATRPDNHFGVVCLFGIQELHGENPALYKKLLLHEISRILHPDGLLIIDPITNNPWFRESDWPSYFMKQRELTTLCYGNYLFFSNHFPLCDYTYTND